MTTKKRLTGKPADKKGKYVRISQAAYDEIQHQKEKHGMKHFITTLDVILGV